MATRFCSRSVDLIHGHLQKLRFVVLVLEQTPRHSSLGFQMEFNIKNVGDLSALINVAKEDYSLEFKAGSSIDNLDSTDGKVANAAKLELIKDVTGMAHAAGGRIVYGVATKEIQGESVANSMAPVTINKITSDRLTSIISSNTEPQFSAFTINVMFDPSNAANKYVVIEVEQARTAHQSKIDKRYYRRINSIVQAMHDFEIREVMNRYTAALVAVRIDLEARQRSEGEHLTSLKPILENIGARSAKQWELVIDFPSEVPELQNAVLSHYLQEILHPKPKNGMRRFRFTSESRFGEKALSIMPGQILDLGPYLVIGEICVRINRAIWLQLSQSRPSIQWTLYVEDAQVRVGSVPFETWCEF